MHRAQERWIVLYGFQAAGGKPEKDVFKAGLAAESGPGSCVDLVGVDFDSIGQNDKSSLEDHACSPVRVGNGLADCGYAIGEPVAESVAEMAAERAGGGGMEGVKLDAEGRGEPGPAGKPGGMRQMGVDDVRLFVLDPAVKADPAARVNQALAHAESEELDALGGQ